MGQKPISQTNKAEKDILWFSDISIKDIPLVGGKNASLGEMYSNLTQKGIRVPNGFAITAKAYRDFIKANDLEKQLKIILKDLVSTDVRALSVAGEKIRHLILSAKFPKSLDAAVKKEYQKMCQEKKEKNTAVAVRSSATAEDLPDASFAGQQETYLNVRGYADLLMAVKKCVASLFTDRAISYREAKGFDHLSIALSVTVQEMVRSDIGASGVLFTLDTESGFPGVVLINAAYGLGEYVVKGRVTPDQFYVFKAGLQQGKPAIISKILGSKEVKLAYGRLGGTRQAGVEQDDRDAFAISDKDILELAKWGMMIEEYYGKAQDIEWAKDGKTGHLYIVQARPETVKTRSNHAVIEEYILNKKGKILATGIAVGQRIGAGAVRCIENPRQMKNFKKGEILVTRITDPDWEPVMRMASAIITEQGGKTSHAAIVSRELGVPCIVGAKNARKLLRAGKPVTVSCAEGDEGRIYEGALPFEVKRTEITEIPSTKTKIMMNVGDPDNAFALSFLPNDGVGLAREEFIFTNFIRIHPLALINYNKLKDKEAKKKIADMTRGYANKEEYGVTRLAEGIARIATAFYPHDVIIRFSDFKTNEYATLIGGKEFEPKEENPMLGWRGASRYYAKEYRDGFRLECEAIKRVRNTWGLKNVIVMVPFCRTPEEGEKVLKTMEEFGLKRGENGLQVYVMCEIPSNVILAEEFAKIFDGFSIGSNDLTQLTLGVDRDSALVSHVYNEKNPAVKQLIQQVIRTAHAHGKKVGICGQAPSDSLEFAEFLVREGIDSISLNPDTVLSTRKRIATVEKTTSQKTTATNPLYLSLVAAAACVSALLMIGGAGCAGITEPLKKTEISTSDISPAVVRDKFMKKAQEDQEKAVASAKEEALKGQWSTVRESSFANFTVQYPSHWVLEHGKTSVTMTDATGKEFVRITKETSATSPPTTATTTIVDGFEGVRYQTDDLEGSKQIVDIKVGKSILKIEGQTAQFDRIVASITF